MGGPVVEFAVLVLFALTSLALIATGVMVMTSEARMSRRLRVLETATAQTTGPAAERSAGFGAVLVAPGKDREEIQQYLAAAGYRAPRALATFGLIRLLTTVGGGLGVYIFAKATATEPPLPLVFGMLAAAVGYLAPKQILRMNSARRTRKITAELPFTLDILVMMLESGINIDQCFRTFAQTEGRAAPIVQESVAGLVRDLDVGTPYDVALSRWAERLSVAGARELANVILQALSLGTPLVRVLKEFAAEYSNRRVALARESVNRASVKMTLIMLFFIMPALMTVLVGPAVVGIARTLTGLGQ
jgi:tight adherence protein C